MSISLKILTPDGTKFDGEAEMAIIRTITGNVGLYGEHSNYFSIIENGLCVVAAGGQKRYAAMDDGFITVKETKKVKIVLTTFEWADEIDIERAIDAAQKAHSDFKATDKTDKDYLRLKNKIRRTENRISIAKQFGELKNAQQ